MEGIDGKILSFGKKLFSASSWWNSMSIIIGAWIVIFIIYPIVLRELERSAINDKMAVTLADWNFIW